MTVTRAAVAAEIPRALAPGEAFVRNDGIAVVRAGDGGVELHRGRREDDDERELDAAELAALVRA